MADSDDAKVEYTVKELLGEIRAAVAKVDGKLDGKADRDDLGLINARLDAHGREIGAIKDRLREDEAADTAITQQRERTAFSGQRKWTYAFAAAMAFIGVLDLLSKILHW